MRWMVSNVAVETDAAGNEKPTRKKSAEKIDGVVAMIMALYTHLFSLLALGVMILFALWVLVGAAARTRFPFRKRSFAIALAFIALAYAPMIPFLFKGLVGGDALGGEALPGPALDEGPMRLTQASPARRTRNRAGGYAGSDAVLSTKPGGRNGWFWGFRPGGRNGRVWVESGCAFGAVTSNGPGGRNGWFWMIGSRELRTPTGPRQPDIPGYGRAIATRLPGDSPLRPAPLP